MKERGMNINSLFLATLTLAIGLCGYLARIQLEEIKSGQTKLWTAIMPRQEIEVRMEAIKSENTRTQSDVTEIRSRLTQIELQLKLR